MNIHEISSYIYNNTAANIDTDVIDGERPDDTIKVFNEDDTNSFLCICTAPDFEDTLLATRWYGGEPVEEDLYWNLNSDDDTDTLDEICEYATQNL